MTLPRSLDELRGLRAARWIRESTSGQWDAFGPDAQREHQDHAIERWGLADTGLAWQVAHSGYRKRERHGVAAIASTEQWREMLERAGIDYDVLVVGYVSRFARDAEVQFTTRRQLHAAGAALLFVDEKILSSDEESWDAWAREAVEAESYSRKHGRRVREGYAAKRRRLGEPGGRAPYGLARAGRPPLLAHGHVDHLERVRAAYRLASGGETDRSIADGLGLPIDTVRGILTNPIYVGRLRDGSPASVEPVVEVATWEAVQRIRRGRARTGGHTRRQRTYALPMLRCAACGRRLIGDSGRYRHLEPCAEFTAARRRRAFKNQLVRAVGASYPAAFYEDLVELALREVALSTKDLTAGATWYQAQKPVPDELALRRLAAERERCLSRYARDRDVGLLERRMAELDAEEKNIRTSGSLDQPPDWREVLELVRELPALWADEDARPEDRRALAEAAFASVDALGARSVAFTMTPSAGGVQCVVGVGARGFNPTVTVTRAPWLPADAEQAFGTGG